MSTQTEPGRVLTYVDALREAQAQEMRRDESVFVFGLDVVGLRLFLLTDSDQIIDTYTKRYGDRVFHIDCSRTTGLVPLTWRQSDNRRELGAEVIMDTYLAAACDYFIGHGGSNVACMVACLKRWPDGTLHLLDDNAKTRRNWLLHDW